MDKFKKLPLKEKIEYIVCCMLYPFIILFHKLAKPVKQMKKTKRRMGAGILATVMVCTMLPVTVFASETNGMIECHPVHDESCDYIAEVKGVPCSHLNDDECGYVEAEKGAAAVPFAVERVVAKRTTCLDLRNTIIDKDGNSLIPTDGVYDMLIEEGWKWDKNTSILTLNGVNLDVSGDCGIILDEDATIELMGNNSVVTDASIAIQNFGNITIDGTGSIEVRGMLAGIHVDDQLPNTGYNINMTGGEVNVTSKNDSAVLADGAIYVNGSAKVEASGYYCGLQANGSGITISDATVTATSSNDSAIFTKGTLTISDSADITATDSLYSGVNAKGNITITDSTVKAGGGTNTTTGNSYTAIYTPQTLTIDGTSDVTADGDWRGMDAETALSIGGNVKVTATGSNSGLQSKDISIFGNAVVEATSTTTSGIAGYDSISITGKANVTATGVQAGIASNGSMNLSAENIEAIGDWYGIDNEGDNASGITIGGKLTAVATGGHGIYGTKSLTGDDKADITATGTMNGIQLVSNINFTGSKVEAIGNGGNGISSKGKITIDSGAVHAKGASTYAAIRTENVQAGSNVAESKISLTNLIEKNGGKVAFCDWVSNGGEMISWTSFIAKDDDGLTTTVDGGYTNGLLEVWLAAPHTHTPSSEWSEDAVNHWHNCVDNDGTKLDSAAHNFGKWVIDKEATETEAGSKHRDCNICKYKETIAIPVESHTHTPSSEWSKDAKIHWHNCTANDGELMNAAAHIPGEAATAEHSQICTVCGYEIAPKLPSNSTLVDAATGTKAEYEDGSVFGADIVLSITSKPQAEMDNFKDSVNKVAPGLTLGGLYDVKLLKDGVAIQPDGKVKVSIPLTDAMKAMTDLKVVYIDDNGNVRIIPSEVKNGMIIFITDHFSNYGVIGKVKVTDSGNNTGSENNNDNTHSPQTGDNSPMLLFVLMICASGTVLVTLDKKRKVFRNLKK